MRIEALEIHDGVLDKIETRHGIEFYEVKEACYSNERHMRRAREGLYKVFSRTEAGRYILVVLADRGEGLFGIVTARDMTGGERRLYIRQRGG